MSATTSSRIAEKYQLSDGRVVTILRAKACIPVGVENHEGVLFVGSLQVVLRPMSSLHAQMLASGGLDHGVLNKLREDLGGHFPGVYLFDLLCRNVHLMPLFPMGTTIIFLGSKAVCTVQETLTEPLIVIPKPGAPKKKGVLDWLFLRKKKGDILPEVVSTACGRKQELGYFAFTNQNGVVLPWFVSEDGLVDLIRSDDHDHFILEAREPA